MTNFEHIKTFNEEEMALYLTDLMASFIEETLDCEIEDEVYSNILNTSSEFLGSDYIKPSEYLN